MDHEEAAIARASWARRQRIVVAFDLWKVAGAHVIYLLLKSRAS